MSKRTLYLLIAALVVVAGAGYGYSRYSASQAEPTPEVVVPADLKTTIWASGKVVPAQWATLSTPIGGQVMEIAAAEGDTVQAGAILLRLDDADLQANVRTAQAALAAAQAELARLKAAPRPAQLAAAEDDIRLAEAGLQSAQAAVTQAEAALANANAQLAQAEAGLLAAQATLHGAEASLQRLRNGPTQAEKETAFARLKQAQAEYDKIAWAGEVSLTPQALALEQATLEYQAAQATYQSVVSGPTEEDIAAAEAAVESA
ncbi:MAG: biotin/lipoyl-binding protein, partial [Caldilineae bacterium]